MTHGATREASVPASHPALPGHFPGAPIVPAAWQLTLVEQVCRDVLGEDLRITGLASARFRAPWAPGDRVAITVSEASSGRVRFLAEAGGVRVAEGVFIVERRAERP